MKRSVNNAVVFVTGTNREKGIGRALVEEAIRRGAKKVYASARDISQLHYYKDKKFQGKVVLVKLDVTNKEEVVQAAKIASDTQILINNAGFTGDTGALYNYSEKLARKEMEVNYFAPINITNVFKNSLVQNGRGTLVYILSIGALQSRPFDITYAASKAALFSLIKAARMEIQKHSLDIAVFGVYPGPVDTDMNYFKIDKESPSRVAQRIFDDMERGVLDITPDRVSSRLRFRLKENPEVFRYIMQKYRVA